MTTSLLTGLLLQRKNLEVLATNENPYIRVLAEIILASDAAQEPVALLPLREDLPSANDPDWVDSTLPLGESVELTSETMSVFNTLEGFETVSSEPGERFLDSDPNSALPSRVSVRARDGVLMADGRYVRRLTLLERWKLLRGRLDLPQLYLDYLKKGL